jgi:hypothetical protein
VATLGRLDQLRASGEIDRLVRSAARFSDELLVLDAREQETAPEISTYSIGPALVFERLWRETGCRTVLEGLLGERSFGFPVERAIFMTVLHRLMESGSDRSALKWLRDVKIEGTDGLELQHLYRAMGWLGEELGDDDQCGATPFAPRATKDLVEERSPRSEACTRPSQ